MSSVYFFYGLLIIVGLFVWSYLRVKMAWDDFKEGKVDRNDARKLFYLLALFAFLVPANPMYFTLGFLILLIGIIAVAIKAFHGADVWVFMDVPLASYIGFLHPEYILYALALAVIVSGSLAFILKRKIPFYTVYGFFAVLGLLGWLGDLYSLVSGG